MNKKHIIILMKAANHRNAQVTNKFSKAEVTNTTCTKMYKNI